MTPTPEQISIEEQKRLDAEARQICEKHHFPQHYFMLHMYTYGVMAERSRHPHTIDNQDDVQYKLDMDVYLLGVAYYILQDGKKVRIDPTQLIQVTETKPTPDIGAPYLRSDDPDLYTTFPD